MTKKLMDECNKGVNVLHGEMQKASMKNEKNTQKLVASNWKQ